MNKKNKILVGCLALLLVLSVGYALFSETITINGTATAKGSFDIEATCEKSINSDMLSDLFQASAAELGEGGYVTENEVCSVSGSTVTVSTELQYPSAKRFFTIKMENVGTMDAFVKSSDSTEGAIDISENIKIYNSETDAFIKEINTHGQNVSDENKQYARTRIVAGLVKDTDGTFILDDEVYFNKGMLFKGADGSSYLKIKPGQTFYLVLNMEWPEEATTQGVYSVNTSQIIFDFMQQTSDFTESSEAYTCFGGC